MLVRTLVKLVDRTITRGPGSFPLSRGSKRRVGHLGAVQLGGGVVFHPERDAQTAASIADGTSPETIFDGESEGEVEMGEGFSSDPHRPPSAVPNETHEKGNFMDAGHSPGTFALRKEIKSKFRFGSSADATVRGTENSSSHAAPTGVTGSLMPADEKGAAATTNDAQESSDSTSTSTNSGIGKSVEAYRFLLDHIGAEIAALKRRHSSVSTQRTQLENQQASHIKELYNFMENPWMLLTTMTPPALPPTGAEVYLKEKMAQRNATASEAELGDVAKDKIFVLACHRNYKSLPLLERRPYEEAGRHNAALREELKRRLSTGCVRFEEFCNQLQECTAAMVREGNVPELPSFSSSSSTHRIPNQNTPAPPPVVTQGVTRPAASPAALPASPSPAPSPSTHSRVMMSRGRVRVQHDRDSAVALTRAPIAIPTRTPRDPTTAPIRGAHHRLKAAAKTLAVSKQVSKSASSNAHSSQTKKQPQLDASTKKSVKSKVDKRRPRASLSVNSRGRNKRAGKLKRAAGPRKKIPPLPRLRAKPAAPKSARGAVKRHGSRRKNAVRRGSSGGSGHAVDLARPSPSLPLPMVENRVIIRPVERGAASSSKKRNSYKKSRAKVGKK